MVLVLTRWENYTWGHIEVTDREREIEREVSGVLLLSRLRVRA